MKVIRNNVYELVMPRDVYTSDTTHKKTDIPYHSIAMCSYYAIWVPLTLTITYDLLYRNPVLNSLSGTFAVALEHGASADITWECKK